MVEDFRMVSQEIPSKVSVEGGDKSEGVNKVDLLCIRFQGIT